MIYGIATSAASSADAAIKSAQSIGMTTAAYTEFSYAAKMAGVSEQEFTSSSARLGKIVQEALGGNKKALEAFARAGISLRDAGGDLKTTEQLFGDLSDVFASMPDGIGKTSLAMAFFGESGTKLIPFLNGGSAGMNQLREDARRLGISLSETDAKNAEAFNDSFANIGQAMRGVSLTIGKVLWPVLTKVHTAISKWVAANGQLLAQELPKWIEEIEKEVGPLRVELDAAWQSIKSGARDINAMVQSMGGWIPVIKKMVEYWLYYRGLRIGVALFQTARSVIALKQSFVDAIPAMARWIVAKKNAVFGNSAVKGLTAFGSSMMTAVMPALAGAASAFGGAATATWGFTAALLANPITWVIAGIAALGGAIYLCVKYWDDITAAMSKAWDWIKGVFVAGWDMLPGWVQEPIAKIAEIVSSFGGKVWSGIKKDWERVCAFFEPLFSTISAIFTGAWGGISNIVSTCISAISGIIGTAVEWWGQQFNTAWSAITTVFEDGWSLIPDWVTGPISKATQAITDFGTMIWGGLIEIWDRVIGALSEKFSTIGNAFENSFVGGIVETIKQFNPASLFMDALGGLVRLIIDFDIVSAAANLMTRFGEGLLSAWDSIKGSIASAIVDFIPGGEKILNVAATGADYLKSGAASIGSTMSGAYDTVAGLFHANGGIFTTPHVGMVAEAGPEAIVPLNRPERARDIMGAAANMLGMGNGRNNGATVSVSYSPTITIAGAADKGTVDQMNVGLARSREQLRAMIREVLNDTAYNSRRLALW